jgi:hypothetical protein
MPILDDQELAVRALEREGFRLKVVSTKLSSKELADFERLAKSRGVTPANLIRQLILRELRNEANEPRISTELIEAIGLRLMLTNLLKPIATGQKITSEIFDAIMAEVRKTKREVAVEVQRQAEGM